MVATEGMGAVAQIYDFDTIRRKVVVGMTQHIGWTVKMRVTQGELNFIMLSKELPTEVDIRVVATQLAQPHPVGELLSVQRSIPVVEVTAAQ